MVASRPTFCAETPMYASPLRMISLCANDQSGAPSAPPETLNHSITTLPLNFAGSIGFTTTKRDVYAAVVAGCTVHFPSDPSGPTLV